MGKCHINSVNVALSFVNNVKYLFVGKVENTFFRKWLPKVGPLKIPVKRSGTILIEGFRRVTLASRLTSGTTITLNSPRLISPLHTEVTGVWQR